MRDYDLMDWICIGGIVFIVGYISLMIVLFSFGISSTAGLFYPIQEEEALAMFKALAVTEDVEIVSHSRYSWDTSFALLIDERPATGHCVKQTHKQMHCEFAYVLDIELE